MKREVIEVPQDKSVLNVLAKLGEQTKNSRIFFHLNLYRKISKRKAPFAGSFRLSCFSDYLVSVVSIVVSSMKFALLANFLTDSIADSAAALDLYPSPTPYMVPSTLKIL